VQAGDHTKPDYTLPQCTLLAAAGVWADCPACLLLLLSLLPLVDGWPQARIDAQAESFDRTYSVPEAMDAPLLESALPVSSSTTTACCYLPARLAVQPCFFQYCCQSARDRLPGSCRRLNVQTALEQPV